MNSDLPFEIDQKYDLFKILEHPHEIPYHSRPFMWTREAYVEHVVRQAIRKFSDGAPHWLGFVIIHYNKALNRQPSASDAQHRLTVYYLMWMACAELLGNTQLLAKISRYGTDDDLLEETVSPDDAHILERYEWRRMPNIVSVYQQDFEALGNLLNGRRPDKAEAKTSLIYGAYDAVLMILAEALPDVQRRRDFLQFIYKNTKVSRMIISDWNFALEVFDVINNIKVKVPSIYLLKNALVRRLGEAASVRIHESFHRWEQQIGAGSPFDQFMHLMASLFSRQWCTLDNYPQCVLDYIEKVNLADPMAAFSAVVERGLAIREWMTKTPYANLLLNFAGGHEVMDHCLMPILFHAGDRLDTMIPFVRALIAYGIRCPGRFSFNPAAYRGALLGTDGPIAKLIEGRETVDGALYGVRKLLVKWLAVAAPAKERIERELFKTAAQFQKARAILLYIAERTDAHEAVLDHRLVDIDHISPKQPRKGDPVLSNPENTHRIGNFTPFMGKNSAAGLKGNRSLGNQPYAAKREMYAQSNIAMTRRIAAAYPTDFADAQIDERSRSIAELVDKLTSEDLGGL